MSLIGINKYFFYILGLFLYFCILFRIFGNIFAYFFPKSTKKYLIVILRTKLGQRIHFTGNDTKYKTGLLIHVHETNG